MDPRSLVPHFDPLEDREPGVFTCLEAGAVHQLFLQDRPQTFHHRVVVAITRATHALLHAEIGKHLAAFATRVLHTARRMMRATLRRCKRVTALRGGLRMDSPCDLTSATAASRNSGVLGTHTRHETHSFGQAQTCRWGCP